MKKEELKYDPIREKIISIIEYIESNKNYAIQILILIVVFIFGWGYKNSIDKDEINLSKSMIGIAQNNYNSGQKDISIDEMKKIINEFPNSDASIQAVAYLMKNSYEQNDDNEVIRLFEKSTTTVSDPVFAAFLHEIAGNSYLNIGDPKEALSNFEKSLKLIGSTNLEHTFKINVASTHIAFNDYKSASKVLTDLLSIDELNYTDKSKVEEFLAFTKFNEGI